MSRFEVSTDYTELRADAHPGAGKIGVTAVSCFALFTSTSHRAAKILGCLPNLGVPVDLATNTGDSRNSPNDVGTLWTMRRLDHSARCVVMAWPGEWELRVLVDGEQLLSERRPRGDEAFALGEQLKVRMLDAGWEQVVPNPHQRARIRRQPSSGGSPFRR